MPKPEGRQPRRTVLQWAGLLTAVLAALLLATLALPIRRWRTGEMPVAPLPVVPGGPPVSLPRRVWIDTDPACGHSRSSDPDDCLAILLLARTPGIELVGISTVHGNAPLEVTDRTARELADRLRAEGLDVPVHRGSGDALARALAAGPLTVLSLGPLTNLELTLRRHPTLAGRVGRLVAVMGRRPGHLFHPTENRGAGAVLLGHGPVFRDLNFAEDSGAAAAIVARRLPTTLIPYDVARQVLVGAADLDRIAAAGEAGTWVANRSRGWLEFWRTDVGLDGFYPFDAVAAMYVADPGLFSCARASAWVGQDQRLGWIGRVVGRSAGLLVGPGAADRSGAGAPVLYCSLVAQPELHHLMLRRLATPP